MDKSHWKIGHDVIQVILRSKGIFVLVSFIIVCLIVDASVVKISSFTGGLASLVSDIAIFTGMALIFSIGQYFILAYVKKTNHTGSSHESIWPDRLHKSVSILQYVLVGFFGVVITQMVITSSYNVFFLGI